MSFSNVSGTQRQQQEEALKKVLALSLLGSAFLHGVALPFSLNFVKPAEFAQDSIEVVMLDEPKVEETQPEPAIEEKVSPPPETLKPEPPPEQTPPEEPPVPPTPPPIPQEPPVPPTPPPTPQEPPVPPTPPPETKEELPTETPPPTPEPSPPPKEDSNPQETPKSSSANEREKPSPDPPKGEPPVKTSRPKGAENVGDITKDAGNPNSSGSPEKDKPSSSASVGSGESSSEELDPSSGPIQRSPTTGSPVRTARPRDGDNSGSAIGDTTNPSSSDSPGGSASNSPSGASENGDIGSSDPFGTGSGRSPRTSAAGSPVRIARPREGGNSGSAIGGSGNLASRGSPGGSPSNSSSGGGGNDGGGSSEPFASGSGQMPKQTNPGTGGSPSRPNGLPPGTCISGCDKIPEYPSAARDEGWEGQVGVTFDIDPNGKPFNIRVSTPSKYKDLDRAAIKHIQKRKYAPSESVIQGVTRLITFDLIPSKK